MNVSNEILRYLPHRYPFLLVDRILEFVPEKSLTALKNVTHNESFFQGHFPSQPVMPGVLIIEALAQTACLLTLKTEEFKNHTLDSNLIYLVGIDGARFKQMVVPGDQLNLHVEHLWDRQRLWRAKCVATVNNQIACSAEITGTWGAK